ncbi:MAG: hypothetical protein ACLQMH_14225 [Solirubrobacteraceae bacterium]
MPSATAALPSESPAAPRSGGRSVDAEGPIAARPLLLGDGRDLIALRVWRLGGYVPDDAGPPRALLAVALPDETTLVLDCLAGTLADARLIAHLSPEEPVENARIVADMYLGDDTRGRCRRLSAQDLRPTNTREPRTDPDLLAPKSACLCDSRRLTYAIREVAAERSAWELRWTRSPASDRSGPFDTVVLRNVVAALEDYEPARTITAAALAAHRHDARVSTRHLGEESQRLARSPIVLNRRLREAVQHTVARGLTMSEIAMRCGRTKRDRNGNRSGEATWLARRIGQMPEGGQAEPTPWVHSDTLALIAREGLGLSPNEVEL